MAENMDIRNISIEEVTATIVVQPGAPGAKLPTKVKLWITQPGYSWDTDFMVLTNNECSFTVRPGMNRIEFRGDNGFNLVYPTDRPVMDEPIKNNTKYIFTFALANVRWRSEESKGR